MLSQETPAVYPRDAQDLDFPDDDLLAMKDRVVAALISEVAGHHLQMADNDAIRGMLQVVIDEVLKDKEALPERRKELLWDAVWDEVAGLGPLQYLLEDAAVTRIVVKSPTTILVEREGQMFLSPRRFRHTAHLVQAIEKMLAPSGKHLTEQAPAADGRLAHGAAVHIAGPPLSDGPCLSIFKGVPDLLPPLPLVLPAAETEAS